MNENTPTTPFVPQTRAEIVADRVPAPEKVGVIDYAPEQSSVVEVAKAAWRRDNLLGAAITNLPSLLDKQYDGDFNVFGYFGRNRADFEDLTQYVLDGQFDGIRSERDFLERARLVRQQIADAKTISNGGAMGFITQLGVGLADPTNLIPFLGASAKAGRIVNAARVGGSAGAVVAGQELALHGMQETRTVEESALAVTGAMLLGGGLGALMPHKAPGGRLHPEHPENPLVNPGTEEVRLMRTGEAPDENIVINQDSVGAMRRTANDLTLAESDNAFLAAMQRIPQKVFDHFSPLARAWYWPSDAGRELVLSVVDPGGRLTKGMKDGKRLENIEALNAVDRQYLSTAVSEVERLYRETNIDLGQSKLSTNLKILASNFTPGASFDKNLLTLQTFKDGIARIGFARAVNDVRMRGDLLESLERRGFDAEQAELIVRRMEKAYEKIDSFQTRLKERAIKEGLLDPDKDLGGAYGLPIVFSKRYIDMNPNEARDFFVRMLADRPPKEWVETFIAERQLAKGEAGPDGAKTLMTVEDLQADSARWSDAILEWRGEQEQLAIEAAARRMEAADKAVAKAKAEMEVMLHGQRVSDSERKAASRGKLKAEVRVAEAKYFARVMQAAMLRAEKASERVNQLRDQYPDLFKFADDILKQFQEQGGEIDQITAQITERMAEQAQKKAATRSLREDVKAAKVASPEELQAARARVAEALEEQKAATAALNEARDSLTKAAQRSRNTNRWLDAVAERIRQDKEDLELLDRMDPKSIDEMLKVEGERIAQLQRKLEDVTTTYRTAVEEWRAIRRGVAIGRGSMRASLREQRQAERLSRKVQKATPLHQYVDELVDRIRGGRDIPPEQLLMDKVAESGRLKERKLPWSPEAMREAMSLGVIETDLFSLARHYNQNLSGRINMKRVLGTNDIEALLKHVDDDYQRLIDRHKQAGNVEAAARLGKMREKNIEDARHVLNKALGRTRLFSEGEEGMARMADRLAGSVFMSAGGSFVFSALGDVAVAMLVSSNALPGLIKHGRSLTKLGRLAKADVQGAEELQSLLHSMEASVHLPQEGSLMAELSDLNARGIGAAQSRTFGEKVDSWLAVGAERVNTLSGLGAITDRVRQATTLSLLDRLSTKLLDPSKLSKAEIANFASLGIGTADAKRLGAMFAKYGTREEGLFLPNLSKWHVEPDGDYLRDVFEQAVVLAQRRASYVPGYGSVGIPTSKWWGKLVFQFQSYAQQFSHSFLLSGSQRLLATGDLSVVAASAALVTFGMMTSALRAVLRGENPDEWDQTKWAWEIVNRSGMLGYWAPYADAMIKTFGDNVNNAVGAKVFEPSSRFRQNNAVQSLVGPWASYLQRPVTAANQIADGDTEKGLETLSTLVPLNQQVRAIASIPDIFD